MLLSLLVISVHFRCYMNTLLDSLFCGKATAVATVHRTVAKSRLSSPTEQKEKPHQTVWFFFLAPPVGLEPTTCGLTVRRSTD